MLLIWLSHVSCNSVSYSSIYCLHIQFAHHVYVFHYVSCLLGRAGVGWVEVTTDTLRWLHPTNSVMGLRDPLSIYGSTVLCWTLAAFSVS
jgi:hypothetical protein